MFLTAGSNSIHFSPKALQKHGLAISRKSNFQQRSDTLHKPFQHSLAQHSWLRMS